MRILWLCNIMLPVVAEELGLPFSNKEGWLSGIYDKIAAQQKAVEGREAITLGVCFPVTIEQMKRLPAGGRWRTGFTYCYGFIENIGAPEVYDAALEQTFREILEDFQPDLVHIFGTEYPHALAMAQAFDRPKRILAGIQGLCYKCAESYLADVPPEICRRKTFRDFIKKDGLLEQQRKFFLRGEREKELLQRVGNITGRTEFDQSGTEKIHRGSAKYYFMNETMREPFYEGRWDLSGCVPYSIFLNQGDYPLKGFHYMLKAMPRILKKHPDACLFVAGANIIGYETLAEKLKISSYGWYLRGLIRKLGLLQNVHMLGRLSALEMKEQYLKCSVFVCPSSMENSPNSVGEAMLLGVPVVAARVGGIPSMLREGEEGLLYQGGSVEDLAAAVLRVWQNPEKASAMADAAVKRARKTHDPDENFRRLKEIYSEIVAAD